MLLEVISFSVLHAFFSQENWAAGAKDWTHIEQTQETSMPF